MSVYVRAEPTPPPPPKKEEKVEPQAQTQTTDIEPPLTGYEAVNKKPFTVEHYELPEVWEPFSDDVSIIETYLQEKAEKGEIENSTQAAKELLKKVEKMVNSDKTERTVVKLAKVAAYIKFLKETENITRMSYKYA